MSTWGRAPWGVYCADKCGARRACVVWLASLCVAASVGPAGAFVDVEDPCPLPIPYPPADAATAAVWNPSMEEGFTGGVANRWVGWQEAGLSGQLHYADSTRVYDGTFSQLMILPQPPDYGARDAGLYQQIYVIPGQVYSASVRVYLNFPAQQYNGEDLLAWIGLDAFGEPKGDGGGMVWTEASQQNQWLTISVQATAVLPVMTLGLKATRKFPQHGGGARVWFDQVAFSGPAPVDPRPTALPDPVDPETRIPETTGPNRIANPSFEEPFADGVSAGWQAWSVAGTGRWRQSTRVGKVGGGRYDCGSLQAMVDMNPKTVLLYGIDPETGRNGVLGDVAILAQYPHLENTIILGRPDIDGYMARYLTDPLRYGRQLADRLHARQADFPRVDAWLGLNEPDWGGTWQQTVAFEKAFADRAHELGLKVCSLNLSTGSPGNNWRMVDESYDPSCRDLLAVADYLGQHCYGGPADDIMVTNQVKDDACDFALRPRRFWDLYARLGWRFPPVISTEGSTWGGSVDYWGPERMALDLTRMGDYMQFNRWWCGYTNFVVGGSCGWGGFEIADKPTIIAAVGQWNADHPSDAMDGLYAQMFGAGEVHPKTAAGLTPAGLFDGGIVRRVEGLAPGKTHLLICWMKYEFRGHQPTQLRFQLGVDPTGQTADGGAATIDWGADQIAAKAPVHEIFSHVWRTFVPTANAAAVWLRAAHPTADPSFMVYVDQVEVREIKVQGSPATLGVR